MMLQKLDRNSIVVGWPTKKRTWVLHVSWGLPLWWKPDFGRKKYNGVTEWRTGWLLLAAQLASRPHG